MNRLKISTRRFLHDESGLVLAETLIMLPLLVWTFIALFVYWDTFRVMNVTQKATYSIADLLSRQEDVTPEFLDGLLNVMTFLTPGLFADQRLRITSIEYCKGKEKYEVLFSRWVGGGTPLVYDNASVQALKPRIPTLEDRESVIIVETSMNYDPAFDTGVLTMGRTLDRQTFTQFIVTKPRDLRVCLESCPVVCE
jgi:hypothetical protein